MKASAEPNEGIVRIHYEGLTFDVESDPTIDAEGDEDPLDSRADWVLVDVESCDEYLVRVTGSSERGFMFECAPATIRILAEALIAAADSFAAHQLPKPAER